MGRAIEAGNPAQRAEATVKATTFHDDPKHGVRPWAPSTSPGFDTLRTPGRST